MTSRTSPELAWAVKRKVAAAAALLTLTFATGVLADEMKVDPSIPEGSLKGKKVLVSPYWLDAFGTANSSWITRMLEPYGVKVDAVNPNGTASKQQDELSTALANHTYDVIVWQPVDSQTAPENIKRIQDEKIPQVVQFAAQGLGGLSYSVAAIDWKASFVEPGKAAAEFVQKHANLGPVKVAWMGPIRVFRSVRTGSPASWRASRVSPRMPKSLSTAAPPTRSRRALR